GPLRGTPVLRGRPAEPAPLRGDPGGARVGRHALPRQRLPGPAGPRRPHAHGAALRGQPRPDAPFPAPGTPAEHRTPARPPRVLRHAAVAGDAPALSRGPSASLSGSSPPSASPPWGRWSRTSTPS